MRTLPRLCNVRSELCGRGSSAPVKTLIKPCSRYCRTPDSAAQAERGNSMSREALQESLSALLDNETDELELRRVLAASGESEVRSTWARYQVARAVMHKELLEPRLDLAAAVSAALADEPVP